MLETVFIRLAEELEAKIREGIYRVKLPSVRKLAEDLGVAPATVQKATGILAQRGIITPSGPKGNLINIVSENRPSTGLIGVFCNRENPDIQGDVLLHSIRNQVQACGKKALFMNLPGALPADADFWRQTPCEGYIFLYSSMNEQLAQNLNLGGIPFVVANWAPDSWHCHWCDFAVAERSCQALRQLAEQGCNHIGVAMPVMAEHFKDFYCDELNHTAHDLNVQLTFEQAEQRGLEAAYANAKVLAARLLQQSVQGILAFQLPGDALWHEFQNHHIDLPVFMVADPEIFPAEHSECINLSYKELGVECWKLLRKRLENPSLPPQNKTI